MSIQICSQDPRTNTQGLTRLWHSISLTRCQVLQQSSLSSKHQSYLSEINQNQCPFRSAHRIQEQILRVRHGCGPSTRFYFVYNIFISTRHGDLLICVSLCKMVFCDTMDSANQLWGGSLGMRQLCTYSLIVRCNSNLT